MSSTESQVQVNGDVGAPDSDTLAPGPAPDGAPAPVTSVTIHGTPASTHASLGFRVSPLIDGLGGDSLERKDSTPSNISPWSALEKILEVNMGIMLQLKAILAIELETLTGRPATEILDDVDHGRFDPTALNLKPGLAMAD